jgi:hypothetical protein
LRIYTICNLHQRKSGRSNGKKKQKMFLGEWKKEIVKIFSEKGTDSERKL